MKRLFAGLIGLVAFASITIYAATFQPVQLFLDLNTAPQPVDSYPSTIGRMGTIVFMSGQDATGHDALYRTDGTTAGSYLVHSFATSNLNQFMECLWSSNTWALFHAVNAAGDSELWRSDGSVAGTYRLFTQPQYDQPIYFMGEVGGKPVFWANDGTHGTELMVSDGTVPGTRLAIEMTPGASGGYTSTGSQAVINGRLYFAHHEQLWVTDTAPAGVQQVSNYTVDPANEGFIDYLAPFKGGVVFRHTTADGTSSIEAFDGVSTLTALHTPAPTMPQSVVIGAIAVIGSHTVFTVWDTPTGATQLWTTDGTVNGTHRIAGPNGDLDPGFLFVPAGTRLIFNGRSAATGAELWATDGTDAGTLLLREFTPGVGSSSYIVYDTSDSDLTYVRVSTSTGSPIWITDGTVGGTRPVSDLDAGLAANSTNVIDAGFLGADLYFWNATWGSGGQPDNYDLWRYDTTAHTLSKRMSLRTSGLGPLGSIGTSLAFAAWSRDTGFEPWITDGTLAGTKLLANLAPESVNGGSDPGPFMKYDDVALFGATLDGVSGLWRSDGTTGGTQRIGDAAPVGGSYLPPGPRRDIRLGDKLLYGGLLAPDQWELFTTDGTASGTHVVLDLSSTSLPNTALWTSNPAACGAGFVAMDGKVYYGASNLRAGTLYRTDGTAGGTQALGRFPTSARLFNAASTVCVHAAYKGFVYFSAEDPDPNSEDIFLWRNDGTVDGNTRFKSAAGRDLVVTDMFEIDGLLWFTGYDGVQYGLWRSDGTSANTTLQMTAGAFPDQQIGATRLVGNTLYFKSCSGATTVCKLVRTDGTPTGTYALAITDNTSATTLPGDAVTADGKLLFAGKDPAHGTEPWITDGTAGGTKLLADTVAGTDGGDPTYAFQFNGYTYFYVSRVDGNVTLQDLWRTDGTPEHTERTNLMPDGSRVLTPGAVVVGQKALLVGYNDTIGNELWVVENQAPVALPDTATTTTGTAVDIAAATNDSDADGVLDGSSIRVVTPPAHGTATMSAGALRYTSAAGFTGTDTFTYAIADKQRRESAPATVTVTVNAAPSSSSSGGGSSSSSSSSGGAAGGGGKKGGGALDAWLLAALALLAMRAAAARVRSANTPRTCAASPRRALSTTPCRRNTCRR